MKKGKMKYISLILITILTACSSNYVEKKTIINDNSDLLKLNAEICNKYKSDESKTYGCGSAIASSSELVEMLIGKTLEEAKAIKNVEIVEALELPPIKIHCSVLAEDSIRQAIEDYEAKQ